MDEEDRMFMLPDMTKWMMRKPDAEWLKFKGFEPIPGTDRFKVSFEVKMDVPQIVMEVSDATL